MNPVRKYICFLVIGFLGIFIQGTLLKSVAPESMMVPNLALVLVVFLAFYDVTISAVILAFLLGMEMDFATGLLVGPWAASFVAVYGIVSSISQRVFVDSPVAVSLAVFFSNLLATFIYLAFMFQFTPAPMNPISLSFGMIVESLFSAVLAPVIFTGLKKALLPKTSSSGSRFN